jgi:transcriptional regulator with XRE-family HTH domain
MNGKFPTDKILFGIKLRQLRLQKEMAAAELAEKAGLSVSYLSEIEKGKKFPKEEKMAGLAAVLGTTTKALLSKELPKQLAPLEELLRSRFLNELPLDTFGVEFSRVVEIIANAPAKVGAFISTLIELGRNYSLNENSFFYGALRAFQELNNNHLEEIEKAVDQLIEEKQLSPTKELDFSQLATLLEEEFDTKVIEDGLSPYPELDSLRALWVPARKQLLLSAKLTEVEKRFQLAKELGFHYLELADRAYTASIVRATSFEQVLNHYRATYFAVAFLMERDAFIADTKAFFSLEKWDSAGFLELAEKYQATPEMLFQRFSNILPKYFNIDQLFFLRTRRQTPDGHFILENELHLNRQFRSHSKGIEEHSCRRWLALRALTDLSLQEEKGQLARLAAFAQRSEYFLQEETYLCLSIARSDYPAPGQSTSITMGMLLDKNLKRKVRFAKDPALENLSVGSTCERCPLTDCEDRAAQPTLYHRKLRRKRIEEKVSEILNE